MMRLAFLALLWAPGIQGRDFDSTQPTNVLGSVEEVLDISFQHARMIQIGVQQGYFLNDTSVDYNKLGAGRGPCLLFIAGPSH